MLGALPAMSALGAEQTLSWPGEAGAVPIPSMVKTDWVWIFCHSPVSHSIRPCLHSFSEPFQHRAVDLDTQSRTVGNLHYAVSMFDGR